jgi:AraC-like DNA-binding protein
LQNSLLTIYSSAAWVKYIYDELNKAGQDADAILRESGISHRILKKPEGHVNFSSFAQLCELSASAVNDDLFGLYLGNKADPRNLDILWYLGVSSSTLREAIENIARYSRIKNNYAKFELRNDFLSNTYPETFLLDIVTQPFPKQNVTQAEEASISLYLKIFRLWTNTKIIPVEITFKHHRVSRLAEITKLLGCKPMFGNGNFSIRFKTSQLDLPIHSSDDRLLKILQKHGDSLLKEIQPDISSLEQEVMANIISQLPKGRAKAKVIADEMGLTERTLSRRLANKGTTFSKILSTTRRQLFLRYIKQQELSFGHITHLLGYSETSALNNAVKRWTGMTPSQARKV